MSSAIYPKSATADPKDKLCDQMENIYIQLFNFWSSTNYIGHGSEMLAGFYHQKYFITM